jgi:hypothetical protein
MAGTAASQGSYLGSKVVVTHRYCAAKFPKPVKLPAGVSQERARLIRETANKWMNGSTIRYWFFDKPAKYVGAASQKEVVRKAFAQWKALGIGLHFQEVASRDRADVRIAFMDGDGSWSYIGTDVLTRRADPRTMNFGWSLTDDPAEGADTALHEIGHTLGFPHEHQNPFAGIVWNEKAVYAALAGDPNFWSKSTTFHNILEKIQPDKVQGSRWDPNSVMHYPFEPGLILKPVKYRKGLKPAGGLSARDREWALTFYPGTVPATLPQLTPFETVPISVSSGQQTDFAFKPIQTRDYEFRTFGDADSIMALYSKRGVGAKPLAQEDDSGHEHNAHLKTHLKAGEEYVLRLRVRYAKPAAPAAVMVW